MGREFNEDRMTVKTPTDGQEKKEQGFLENPIFFCQGTNSPHPTRPNERRGFHEHKRTHKKKPPSSVDERRYRRPKQMSWAPRVKPASAISIGKTLVLGPGIYCQRKETNDHLRNISSPKKNERYGSLRNVGTRGAYRETLNTNLLKRARKAKVGQTTKAQHLVM